MRTTAIVCSCIWIMLGLILAMVGFSLSDKFFLIFGGATMVVSALAAFFLALKKDAMAEACVLGAGIITLPIGLVLIFIVKAATKKKKAV